MATVLIRLRIASTAAPSAAFLSPRPTQRPGGQRRRLGQPDQLQGEVATRLRAAGLQRGLLSHRALLRGGRAAKAPDRPDAIGRFARAAVVSDDGAVSESETVTEQAAGPPRAPSARGQPNDRQHDPLAGRGRWLRPRAGPDRAAAERGQPAAGRRRRHRAGCGRGRPLHAGGAAGAALRVAADERVAAHQRGQHPDLARRLRDLLGRSTPRWSRPRTSRRTGSTATAEVAGRSGSRSSTA